MGQKYVLRRLVVWLVLALLIVWPISRISGYLSQHDKSYDASLMLYQVALFQVELLASSLSEAARALQTKELDSLRLSAYSAAYTHERLVLAVGESRLTPLHSLDQLVQFVLRLQIAGERALKPEEKETIAKAAQTFKEMFESYGKLISASGKLVSSQNDKLAKLDRDMAELLKKGMLR